MCKIDMIFTSPPFRDEDVPDGNYLDFYDNLMHMCNNIAQRVIAIIQSSNRMEMIYKKYPPKRTIIWDRKLKCRSTQYNPIFLYQMSKEYKLGKYIFSDMISHIPCLRKSKQKQLS